MAYGATGDTCIQSARLSDYGEVGLSGYRDIAATPTAGVLSSQVLFPPERLAKVDGVSSRKAYLAVLGTMFDVTKGWSHYGANLDNYVCIGASTVRA